jgi:hypothetical protein
MATLRLGLRVLDRQLLDRDDVLCGKVDDVLLRKTGRDLRVADILTGRGAWPSRLPRWSRRMAGGLVGRSVTRIGWEHVREVNSAVRLTLTTAEIDARRGPLRQPPSGSVLLSSLTRTHVYAVDGRPLGVVHDIVADRDGRSTLVRALLIGASGALSRLGAGFGLAEANEISWTDVRDWDETASRIVCEPPRR